MAILGKYLLQEGRVGTTREGSRYLERDGVDKASSILQDLPQLEPAARREPITHLWWTKKTIWVKTYPVILG